MTILGKAQWVGGAISAIYLLSQYAQFQWNKVLSQRSQELQARQNLKYRFELNLKDVQFVVESLLVGLKAKLFEELNVEELTNLLKQKQIQTINKSESAGESLLEENKKIKRDMWAALKVKSFTRTLVSVYLVNLVTIFSCVQLSLLGRFAYIDSVAAMKRKRDLSSSAAKLTLQEEEITGEVGDEDEVKRCISEEIERNYLTLSWYLLNVGWKDCVARVERAVEEVVGVLPLTHSVTHETILNVISSVRNAVERDERSGNRFRFDLFLLPGEGEEAGVLAEGGLVERVIEESLKNLIAETRDFVESNDFIHVLENTLEESFNLLSEQFKPVFFDQIVTNPVPSRGISFAAGDDCDSPSAHDQSSKSFPLAGILPLITKTAQPIIIGVPNLYTDMVLNNPKLLTLSTIIYSSWN